MLVLDIQKALLTISCLLLTWLLYATVLLLKDRQRLKKYSGPPMHPILGHLIPVAKTAMQLPRHVHPHIMVTYLMREYNLPPFFILDTRPASVMNLIVADPDIAQQMSDAGLDKHPGINSVIEPLAGKMNMLSTNGAFWKKWRTIFNPGFSVQQIASQIPVMVECAEAFVNVLDGHASADRVFRLEEETTKVTIDVIGRVVCDHDFKTLTTDNEFMNTMRNTLSWLPNLQSINPFHIYNPLRPFFYKYYKYKMDCYIGRVLDEKLAITEAGKAKKTKRKSGIDLALLEYFKETGQNVDDVQEVVMDAEFRKAAIDNLLILLFAGHDTTASTLCYCYHILSKHPTELAKVRKELDDVFGIGVSAGPQLKQNPYLANKLEYTLAVIKEILRLWPPGSSVRIGPKNFFIKDPSTGESINTEGMLIWPVSMALHRDARWWGPDVDAFKPARFTSGNADKLPANAYRPFEKGARNCIGQELALIEIKVVLAMTLREFEFRAVYDELDELEGDGTIWDRDPSMKSGPQEVFGERMHQILLAAAKPSQGMPARVKRVEA